MYKKLNSKSIFNHPRINIIEDSIVLPNGKTSDYIWIDAKGSAVALICINKDGKILVEKEYSYLLDEEIYQLPGGKISDRETPEAGANRELTEETGLHAKELKMIGSYNPFHRKYKNKGYLFLAKDLELREIKRDDSELEMKLFWFTENEIELLIKEDKIIESNFLACWTLYKIKVNDKI